MNGDGNDYIELVERAKLGDRESLDDLARLMRGRLYVYAYRIMLQDDLAQDIVQESMLEMFKALETLRNSTRFWPWLRAIASNKICSYYKKRQRHRMISMPEINNLNLPGDNQNECEEGLAKLVSEELKQTVFTAMGQLKLHHRAVLTMRCYEEMKFSEIAEELECSEINARVLFHRAKKALHKQFSRKGFGKEFLITALALFGKLTAPSKAAAAGISVGGLTAAFGTSSSIGIAGVVLGKLGSKTALISLAATGAFSVGVLTGPTLIDKIFLWSNQAISWVRSLQVPVRVSTEGEECWYYYPEGMDGTVMTRLVKWDGQRRHSYCEALEDEQANYYFDDSKNIIYINNYRILPNERVTSPLPFAEGSLTSGKGLLLIARSGENQTGGSQEIIQHHNVLDEEYFRYDLPAGAAVVDNRDLMHKRGWTYFRITGEIDGEQVTGRGQIPFVYSASRRHPPWLRINVAERLEITDSVSKASIYDARGYRIVNYPAGSFFKGLARPWMGLHSVETIRRDAAAEYMQFEMQRIAGQKAEVIVTTESQEGRLRLVYEVNLAKDIIESITFLTGNGQDWVKTGELEFSYLDQIDQVAGEFTSPAIGKYTSLPSKTIDKLWLVQLAQDSLK